MDTLCHAKFANHHCWFDALALIRQTGYEISSLSVPVISRINDRRPCSDSRHVTAPYKLSFFIIIISVSISLDRLGV